MTKFLSVITVSIFKWIIGISILVFLSSCGGDNSHTHEGQGNNITDTGNVTGNANIVSETVHGSATYSDYGWNIGIETELDSELPGKTIRYGIECGYGSYGYDKYFSIIGQRFNTVESIFIDASTYAEYSMYYGSYVALKRKLDTGSALTTEERDLYNEIVNMMNTALRNGADEYQGRLFAEVDGVRYYFCTFSYR